MPIFSQLSDSKQVHFLSIPGTLSFEKALEIQEELVSMRSKGLIQDTWISLEHDAVITRGRGLQRSIDGKKKDPMPIFEQTLQNQGLKVISCSRGGDLTYHGPGQWVLYPICKISKDSPQELRNLHAWIRFLENLIIDSLEIFKLPLPCTTQASASGVWLGEKKIASVGISLRNFVSFHGIALNALNSLDPFFLINPCGFSPEIMTRLQDYLDPKIWDFMRIKSLWEQEIHLKLEKLYKAKVNWKKSSLDAAT